MRGIPHQKRTFLNPSGDTAIRPPWYNADMELPPEPAGISFERFRAYLRVLARLQIDRHVRGKLDPSDVVQQTFVEAVKRQRDFQWRSDQELAAWLRQILAYTLMNAWRTMDRQCREPRREQRLRDSLDHSSMRLEAWFVDERSSPSQNAQRHEHALRVADALTRLPEDYREAVMLKYCEDLSLKEIGRRLDRTEKAVSHLVQRGIKQLRELLRDPSHE